MERTTLVSPVRNAQHLLASSAVWSTTLVSQHVLATEWNAQHLLASRAVWSTTLVSQHMLATEWNAQHLLATVPNAQHLLATAQHLLAQYRMHNTC